MNKELIRRIPIWSGWLRLSHWVIAFGTLFEIASAWAIGQGARDYAFWRDWHLMVGQVIAMALILRAVLLFLPGSGNWRELLPTRSQAAAVVAMIKFYLTFARYPLPAWYAHNPLWKPIYAIILLVLAGNAFTGMAYGLSLAATEAVMQWHMRLGGVVAIFTLLHVLAVFLHDLKGKGAFVSAMISGYRYFHVDSSVDGLDSRFGGGASVNVPIESIGRSTGGKDKSP